MYTAADLIICVTPAVRVFACHSFDLSTGQWGHIVALKYYLSCGYSLGIQSEV
jgi:hypothetical protein